MKILTLARLSLTILLVCIFIGSHAQVTTGTLLEEMINLKKLAEFPSPSFETLQFSSYDRHSITPDQEGWFANSDGFGGESIPGFEKVLEEPGADGIGRYLICDVEGPGAVVRLWTAWIIGDLEVYLDNSETALYDGPAQDFFLDAYDAMAGSKDQFNRDGAFRQNMAGYYPIPFEKNLKMIWIGKIEDLHFYHVQVRMYNPEAQVSSFQVSDLKEYKSHIEQVSNTLLDPQEHLSPQGDKKIFSQSIQAGQDKEFVVLKGEQAITQLKIKIMSEDLTRALRQNIIRISFDGAPSAQVESPIGDFFGAAPGVNPYHSLPFSVLPDGSMICRYYMPYQDSVIISIKNTGQEPAHVYTEVYTEPYTWKKGSSMHFRARWRIDHGLLASYRPSQDIPYLISSGKGVCVGAVAFLYNPTSVPSSWGNWWGEGDEKIYIDQADFPAFFGTGSEDYYNYAWSSSDIFYHAYCGQPRNDGPGNRGFVTNYRWHILDNIPFQSGFAFYMELMSHEPVTDFSYGRTVYLYALPGMYDDHLGITGEDLRHIELPDRWYPEGKKGSHNAKFFQAELLLENQQHIKLEHDRLWSGGSIMAWKPTTGKETLTMYLPIEEAGNYTIIFTFGLDAEGGSFKVKAGDTFLNLKGNDIVNLQDPYRKLSRNYRSQPMQLDSGLNKISIIPAEGNQGKVKIDFIWLMKSR